MSAPFRFPRFFVTSPAPCPYLEGKTERKVFTELSGNNANELNDALGRIGFRRSQSVAYRPSCADCSACVSVRVCASEFVPSNSQKRTIRRNRDLVATACKPWATEEQYALLRAYLGSRHPNGGMADRAAAGTPLPGIVRMRQDSAAIFASRSVVSSELHSATISPVAGCTMALAVVRPST